MRESKPARAHLDGRTDLKPLTPNQTTVQAMQEARSGQLVSVGSLDALMRDLTSAGRRR
ncbi:hypothetical protein [Amorphus sp. 3PC139-8]|uniref:hypothetical protein n=1 Tax=Amorphus sp. 3PC139-8 TaxID=2735676 RepID=UPI00345D9AAB